MNTIKKIYLVKEELDIIKDNAKKAVLNIESTCSFSDDDSQERILENQFVAQLGEAGLSKMITGSIELYKDTRNYRNKNPYKGDGGKDLLGILADIKTSRARVGMSYNYNLWIPGSQYHPEIDYLLGLIETSRNDVVYIVGWLLGKEIPLDPRNNDSRRRGIPRSKLKSMDDYISRRE